MTGCSSGLTPLLVRTLRKKIVLAKDLHPVLK
jgi:hypothetical protein